MEKIKTMKILLSGRVQGVGYRYFVEDRALSMGVCGYVRNTRHNKVEILCQGMQEILDKFIAEIKKGPALARVIEFNMEEVTDSVIYDSFIIDY